MTQQVVIIGAGPVGLCLALACAARGLSVQVVDKQSEAQLADPGYDGREVALTHRSIRLLRALGVWQELPPDAVWPLARARVMDGQHQGFEVSAASVGQAYLGMFVSNHQIRKAAWAAVVRQPRIEVRTASTLESIELASGGARLTLADGDSLTAQVLVAADGRFSASRRAAGIAVHMRDMGLTMVLSRMRHEYANQSTAWEWFGSGQTRALLPVAENEASAVVTVPGREAQRLMALSDADFATEITVRYEGRLGRMEPVSTRHAYPLVATWAARFVAPRFALVGDAAVGMHPVTAHGFNLGLTGVELLAQALAQGSDQAADLGSTPVLARYERRLRASAGPLFLGTQLVARLFTNEHALAQPLRRLILTAGAIPCAPRTLAALLVEPAALPASLPGWALQLARGRRG